MLPGFCDGNTLPPPSSGSCAAPASCVRRGCPQDACSACRA